MRNSIFLILTALFLTACGGAANNSAPNAHAPDAASANSAAPEKKQDDFAERLSGVRTANFTFILVFRRKDGAALPGEDKRFLKENSPSDVNQWVLTGDGKTVIAGTNYRFPPESLEALKTRFVIEDYSSNAGQGAPPETDSTNSNASPTGNAR